MEVVRVARGLQAQELAAEGPQVDVVGSLGRGALRQSLGEEVVIREGFCMVPFPVCRPASIMALLRSGFLGSFGLRLRGQPPVLRAALLLLLLLAPLPRLALEWYLWRRSRRRIRPCSC